MSTILVNSPSATSSTRERQFATFYVGDLLLGIDIQQVQEINRQLTVTPVPHSPPSVRGVINLRGEVATVIDLRTILGLTPTQVTRQSRNMIVHWQGESVGLCVDKVSDILTISEEEIVPSPANVDGVDGRFFMGVHTMETEIVVLLNIDQVLSHRKEKELVD